MNDKFKKFIFNNFEKSSYQLVSEVIGKEKIYYRDGKIVVLLEDEEVGKRIFPVVKSLKQWKETISSKKHIDFKVTDFIADKSNCVQILFADIQSYLVEEWKQLGDFEKLQELVSFAQKMQENGYTIDETVFNKETCIYLSSFLSFFKLGGTENGCLIKYVHYVLSGEDNMEEFYQTIIEKNEICRLRDFPYGMSVIQMCYNYCANGTIPNIDFVLYKEGVERWHPNVSINSSIVGNSDFSAKLPVTKKTENYTVYDNRIKIYREMDDKFSKLLMSGANEGFLNSTREELEDCFKTFVVDFDNNIIGYEYECTAGKNKSAILDVAFESQADILDFVSKLSSYLHGLCVKAHSEFETDKHEFDLETEVVCYPNNNFKIVEVDSLFKLVSERPQKIDEDITMLFFKLLRAYLEKTYGEISDKLTLYEKKEVRYLSPGLAKEFYKFVMAEKVDIARATEKFNSFILYDGKPIDKNLLFDRNFLYNPLETVFLFEQEVKNKYNVKMEKNTKQRLPDGRLVVTFNKRENIYTLARKMNSLNDEIKDKFHTFNKYVEFVEISEIIYSFDLNSNDLYYVSGYITTPFFGEPITLDSFLKYNNKEILQITGMLMTNFGRYFIHWSNIYITSRDDEFFFYINKLDEVFEILRNDEDSTLKFIEKFFKILINRGYNENAFIDLGLDNKFPCNYEAELIDFAERMDAYCEEHKIYYDSSKKMCPVCLKTLQVIEDDDLEHFPKDFEDNYAIHYQLSWHYNLKVYKEGSINMEKIEANIDKIIARRMREEAYPLQQDCFLPYKKALDSKRRFIGYVYKRVYFEDSNFKDIKDTKNLRNLPRIKCLIRLILQVKELVNNQLYFIQNPFGDVFLSKNYKGQVQIVNVEFLGEEGKQANTLKWTCQYILNVINLDKDIDISAVNWVKRGNIDYLLNLLGEYAETLTMFCPIHKIYYKADDLFCPRCVDRTKMKKLDIKYVNSSNISDWKEFGQGGEAIIYEYKNNSVAKVFKEDQIDYSFKSKILSAIIAKTEILEEINQQNHKFKYIFPKKILVDKKTNKILGYIMDQKVKGEPISALCDTKQVNDLGITRKDILEILITISVGVQTLHDKANIFIGDLNGGNILFDKDKNVYFLDFDGMGVDNISPIFWTDGYIDPVSKNNGNITKKDDWYSLAVQAFHYLTFVHPFNGVYEVDGHILEIPERMERRLSLLGNHGIAIPPIAIPWDDWMRDDLKNVFLNTFEGDLRRSIVPELKAQYQALYTGNTEKKDIIPIGSKFIAKKNNPFSRNVVRIINGCSAIGRESNDYYATILDDKVEHYAHFPNCMEIIDILPLYGYTLALAVYSNRIVGFDIRSDHQIFEEKFCYDTDNVVVNDNVLYISRENIIHRIEFGLIDVIGRDKIKFLKNQETVGFLVQFNAKFMQVKRDKEGRDKIYCNSEELCQIDSNSNSKYNILYDDVSKMWLVISTKGKFLIINASNGHYTEGQIPADVNDMNVKNVAFNKGVIYIPSQDNLYIIKTNKMIHKKMECTIMTPNSRLCNFNSQGFSVITDYVLYDVSKK